jgi:broad specificity phosphatase PhoE
VTVYLVRHGSAGRRDLADPLDADRRLDETGRRQAAELVPLLDGAELVLVATSPAMRCVETVEPLAAARSLPVEREDALGEGTELAEAWKLLTRTAALGGDAVLCSHGDVIPELIRRAQGRGMEVPGKAGCSKGSCWALEWDGERFTRGTYTPVKG